MGTEVETDFEFLGNRVSESAGGIGSRGRTSQPANFKQRDTDEGLFNTGIGVIDDLLGGGADIIAVKPTYDEYKDAFKNRALGVLGGALANAVVQGVTSSSGGGGETTAVSQNRGIIRGAGTPGTPGSGVE